MSALSIQIAVAAQNAVHRAGRRLREESGQGMFEYVGVIVVIAGILAAVAATGVGGEITRLLKEGAQAVFDKAGQ